MKKFNVYNIVRSLVLIFFFGFLFNCTDGIKTGKNTKIFKKREGGVVIKEQDTGRDEDDEDERGYLEKNEDDEDNDFYKERNKKERELKNEDDEEDDSNEDTLIISKRKSNSRKRKDFDYDSDEEFDYETKFEKMNQNTTILAKTYLNNSSNIDKFREHIDEKLINEENLKESNKKYYDELNEIVLSLMVIEEIDKFHRTKAIEINWDFVDELDKQRILTYRIFSNLVNKKNDEMRTRIGYVYKYTEEKPFLPFKGREGIKQFKNLFYEQIRKEIRFRKPGTNIRDESRIETERIKLDSFVGELNLIYHKKDKFS